MCVSFSTFDVRLCFRSPGSHNPDAVQSSSDPACHDMVSTLEFNPPYQNRKQQSFKSDFFLSCFSPQESFRYWPGWKTDSWGVYLGYAPHRYGYVRVTAAPCVTSRIPPTIIQVNAELNTRMLLTMCWSLKQEPKNQPPNKKRKKKLELSTEVTCGH